VEAWGDVEENFDVVSVQAWNAVVSQVGPARVCQSFEGPKSRVMYGCRQAGREECEGGAVDEMVAVRRSAHCTNPHCSSGKQQLVFSFVP
jgi:hypothetical protein